MFSRAESNLIFCETKMFGGLHTIAEHPPGFVAQLLRHTCRMSYEARLALVGMVMEHHHHDPPPLPACRLPLQAAHSNPRHLLFHFQPCQCPPPSPPHL